MKVILTVVFLILPQSLYGQGVAVQMGKQYLFAWYDHGGEEEIALMALENIKGKRGIDPAIEERASRIQNNLSNGTTRIVGKQQSWLETYAEYTFVDQQRRPWHLFKFFLDEMILLGFAVSNWHCRIEDQDIIDAVRYCETTNASARNLFTQLKSRTTITRTIAAPESGNSER